MWSEPFNWMSYNATLNELMKTINVIYATRVISLKNNKCIIYSLRNSHYFINDNYCCSMEASNSEYSSKKREYHGTRMSSA